MPFGYQPTVIGGCSLWETKDSAVPESGSLFRVFWVPIQHMGGVIQVPDVESGVIRVPSWCLLGTDRRFLAAVCFGNSRFPWPRGIAIAVPCLLGTNQSIRVVSFRYRWVLISGCLPLVLMNFMALGRSDCRFLCLLGTRWREWCHSSTKLVSFRYRPTFFMFVFLGIQGIQQL